MSINLISILFPARTFKLMIALFFCLLYFGISQETTAVDFPDVTFTDVTEEVGITFEHVTGAFGKKYMPETMCSVEVQTHRLIQSILYLLIESMSSALRPPRAIAIEI